MSRCLEPDISRIRRRKKENRDPNSPWAKARLRWVTQLLVRLGKHTFYPAAQVNDHLQLTETPTYFDQLLPSSAMMMDCTVRMVTLPMLLTNSMKNIQKRAASPLALLLLN
jgi:hypothetical protein